MTSEPLGCNSILIENHYIDRDFIEDYSHFYSRNLEAITNSGKRIHFFRTTTAATERALLRITSKLNHVSGDLSPAEQKLAEDQYLGFTFIKPLRGSPVGRTVLTCFPPLTKTSDRRSFPGTRVYPVHLGPVRLNVRGLAFQQQDVGVSACATTALWSALHKVRDFEEIGAPTPAQITNYATRYSLPFGRPLPSDEGLSLDQMCQAVQALNVAPHVLRASSFLTGRSLLWSSMRSGFAPVMLISAESNPRLLHAVTAVGMREQSWTRAEVGPRDSAEKLLAVYVHDDRIGPYVRANLIERNGRILLETLRGRRSLDRWWLEFLLLPLHPKIRLTLGGLREISIRFVDDILNESNHKRVIRGLQYETFFERSPKYLRQMLVDGHRAIVNQVMARLRLPRYVGVIRITTNRGHVDLLLDSTSTMKNLQCLGIVCSDSQLTYAASRLAKKYSCGCLT